MVKLKVVFLSAALGSLSTLSSGYEWNPPGQNPYRGSLSKAVFSYTHIPYHTRVILSIKLTNHRYIEPDDRVRIYSDHILSTRRKAIYQPTITGMHFGAATKIEGEITRRTWLPGVFEPASVFCSSGYCLALPDVCNNVSQVYQIAQTGNRNTVPEPSTYLLSIFALLGVFYATSKGRVFSLSKTKSSAILPTSESKLSSSSTEQSQED